MLSFFGLSTASSVLSFSRLPSSMAFNSVLVDRLDFDDRSVFSLL